MWEYINRFIFLQTTAFKTSQKCINYTFEILIRAILHKSLYWGPFGEIFLNSYKRAKLNKA